MDVIFKGSPTDGLVNEYELNKYLDGIYISGNTYRFIDK